MLLVAILPTTARLECDDRQFNALSESERNRAGDHGIAPSAAIEKQLVNEWGQLMRSCKVSLDHEPQPMSFDLGYGGNEPMLTDLSLRNCGLACTAPESPHLILTFCDRGISEAILGNFYLSHRGEMKQQYDVYINKIAHRRGTVGALMQKFPVREEWGRWIFEKAENESTRQFIKTQVDEARKPGWLQGLKKRGGQFLSWLFQKTTQEAPAADVAMAQQQRELVEAAFDPLEDILRWVPEATLLTRAHPRRGDSKTVTSAIQKILNTAKPEQLPQMWVKAPTPVKWYDNQSWDPSPRITQMTAHQSMLNPWEDYGKKVFAQQWAERYYTMINNQNLSNVGRVKTLIQGNMQWAYSQNRPTNMEPDLVKLPEYITLLIMMGMSLR